MAEPGALDVSIVSYRCEALLRDCLQSLRDNPPRAADERACRRQRLRRRDGGDGRARVPARSSSPPSTQNLGFGAANNIAIRAGSAPYVLVLNPDTRITAGSSIACSS